MSLNEIRSVKEKNVKAIDIKEAITLSSSALKYVQKIMQGEPNALGIRVGVKTSGCSGKAYVLELAKEIRANDQIFETEAEGVAVIVDESSFESLKGMQLDCVQEGLNEYIKFINPNIQSECGCGESFNTDK